MRKMATIQRVAELKAIPGADKIWAYRVGGWWVVDAVGKYMVGDPVVYCEVDSWIPHERAPFLSKGKEPRVYEGVLGERLRTVKLRGQVSQGLFLPMSSLTNYGADLSEGTDVSEELGIIKWEAPIPAQLAGVARGNFPTEIPKTDQERVQNMQHEIAHAAANGLQFEVTEKLEGSSMTVYLIRGEFGVCSRNLDLKESAENTFWQVARRDGIEEKMRAHDEYWDFAIQGELIGPGIQGNIYKLAAPEFRVFDVYNIQTGSYLNPAPRRELIERMGLKHVPVMLSDKDLGIGSIEEILEWADAKSVMGDITGPWREGIVFKETSGGMTFKAISNKYLLNGGE